MSAHGGHIFGSDDPHCHECGQSSTYCRCDDAYDHDFNECDCAACHEKRAVLEEMHHDAELNWQQEQDEQAREQEARLLREDGFIRAAEEIESEIIL